jgi:CRISPR-associated endonuclease Cas2
MTIIIIFSIRDAKKRKRTTKLLLNYGEKIKPSVFECRLNYQYYKKLESAVNFVGNELKADEFIRIYPLCRNCNKKVKSYGKRTIGREPLYFIA